MRKIPVYFMPGLAASPDIFERIELPGETFEIHLLEWQLPLPQETLSGYAGRIAKAVTEPDPVLIGVSFGGLLVQEMSKFVNPRSVIIISSVKSNAEFPMGMRMARFTKLYKIFPTGIVQDFEKLRKFPLNDKMRQRLSLYEKFLAVRDKGYLDWALEQILLWDRSEPDEKVIHIHGDADEVFPPKYIKGFIPVKDGTHIMIINKYRWLNENLPKIILENSL
jgi:hypothetical protein